MNKVYKMCELNKWITGWVLCLMLVIGLVGCKSTHKAVEKAPTACLSSRVKLTIPHKDALFTVQGTLKLRSNERMQLSFLMPVLRTEVARIELTPDEALLVDRMGKRFVRMTRGELKAWLPKKASFAQLEKILLKAAQPGGKRRLDGRDLGVAKLDKCSLELMDFSDRPFEMTPTQLSSRYREVSPEELLQLLTDLLK